MERKHCFVLWGPDSRPLFDVGHRTPFPLNPVLRREHQENIALVRWKALVEILQRAVQWRRTKKLGEVVFKEGRRLRKKNSRFEHPEQLSKPVGGGPPWERSESGAYLIITFAIRWACAKKKRAEFQGDEKRSLTQCTFLKSWTKAIYRPNHSHHRGAAQPRSIQSRRHDISQNVP